MNQGWKNEPDDRPRERLGSLEKRINSGVLCTQSMAYKGVKGSKKVLCLVSKGGTGLKEGPKDVCSLNHILSESTLCYFCLYTQHLAGSLAVSRFSIKAV